MFKLKATQTREPKYWEIPYTYKKGKSVLKPGDHIRIDTKDWYVKGITNIGDPKFEEIHLGPISFTYCTEPKILQDEQTYYESYRLEFNNYERQQ